MIKNDLIERQGKLISRLYDAEKADDETKALKAAIDADLERLESRPIAKIENIVRK